MPPSKRARLSSMLRWKASNSSGRNARPNPTSSLPREMQSSIAVSPATLIGWLKIGRTAPVTRRTRLVRAATAVRNTIGLGVMPP